ncbi:MAG TPA: hypothetical protein IAB51_01385 [Candidatus Merdivicinus excrementipullorum]|uniref:Uncharacterized protein n=1 Tax=Candidatus Merdivicinus excrementipullorum TaxID=2840867 RepID=A0A9D1FKL4_9FIRM|nr:hypothetical protein [Candidatus Merdivicinus excrementipullorum]
MFTFLSQECKKGQAKARPILSKNTAISQSTKASILLTQMYRGKNLGNSKPGFCKQNPGTRHQASLMTASAASLRARYSFFVRGRAAKGLDFARCDERGGTLSPPPLRFFEKNRVKLLFYLLIQFYTQQKFFDTLRQDKAYPYVF